MASRFVQRSGWWLALIFAPVLAAQEQPSIPLADLKKAADQRTVEWDTLSKTLTPRLAHILPCDPRARNAIEEVSRASGARLAAMARYLDAAAVAAKRESDAAQLLAAEYQRRVTEMPQDAVDVRQEEAATEGLLASLNQSLKVRPELKTAEQALEEIRAKDRENADSAQQRVDHVTVLAALFGQLSDAYRSRSQAAETERQALRSETDRWSAYYAARLARAQTECDVTRGPAPRKRDE